MYIHSMRSTYSNSSGAVGWPLLLGCWLASPVRLCCFFWPPLLAGCRESEDYLQKFLAGHCWLAVARWPPNLWRSVAQCFRLGRTSGRLSSRTWKVLKPTYIFSNGVTHRLMCSIHIDLWMSSQRRHNRQQDHSRTRGVRLGRQMLRWCCLWQMFLHASSPRRRSIGLRPRRYRIKKRSALICRPHPARLPSRVVGGL